MFIREHKSIFSVRLMCKVLNVCKSAYYSWLKHIPSKREQQNHILDVDIKSIFFEHKGRYGAPRITRSLKSLAIRCCKQRVANRMKILNLRAKKWAGDITYIPTKEDWLYLAVVMDLFSKAIIGWSMSTRLKKDLVCNSLTMALFRRKFPKRVTVHSDRGSQYCSKDYRKILQQNELIGSMSRKENCWGNAPF